MPTRETDRQSGSSYLYRALVDAGVETVIGIPGAQTVPFDKLVAERDDMDYVMARHETAIPHIAWGYYEASGAMAATVTIPGPGDTNVSTGLKNALSNGIPMIHIASDVDDADRPREPVHEIEPETFDNVVKENIQVSSRLRLPEQISRAIAVAREPPTGPVRLGIPKDMLASDFAAPAADVTAERTTYDNETAYDRAATLLSDAERPLLFVGGGARRTADGVRVVEQLADRLNAPVASSYNGKGVFPEDDPRALGVTGKHMPEPGIDVVRSADAVLALGTDFDILATNSWTLPIEGSLVHVDIDPTSIGNHYPTAVPIVADVTDAAEALLDRLDPVGEGRSTGWDGSAIGQAVRSDYDAHLDRQGALDDTDPTSTPAAMHAVREAVPEDAIVTVDVGAFRLWAMQTFPAFTPGNYITSGSWAGMGYGLPSAIGAALAEPDRPVLTLTGDGGFYMCIHELHTAVENDANLVAVVFNNGGYGSIINKSPEISDDARTHEFSWGSPDLTTIAEGFGWNATAVSTTAAVETVVSDALDDDQPHLVEIQTKRNQLTAADAAGYDSPLDLDQFGVSTGSATDN
ncbi:MULTISPECIES: thiamine pyrophosphate-binding protein [Salinibaculum]|uniref:thiamine pyrophosphate-binding protein n=1 Tax=Salinibaculum TaxID=2732368 RepID=UPI0030D5971A